MAGRGRRRAAKAGPDGERKLAPVPEVRPQGRRNRRGGAPRGVAVCLCFPAIREIRRGRYQVAPFGASTSLSFKESEGPEPPTHVNSFAGSDDARLHINER